MIKKDIRTADYCVEMPDGSTWAVPVSIIAQNRAEHYKHEFNDLLSLSLEEDTWPLFESDESEIRDWAQNNMNWSDVRSYARLVHKGDTDFQEGWINGSVSLTYNCIEITVDIPKN